MERPLRRWLTGLIAAVLTFLSPGPEAYAQVARIAASAPVTGAAGRVVLPAAPFVPGVPGLAAPATLRALPAPASGAVAAPAAAPAAAESARAVLSRAGVQAAGAASRGVSAEQGASSVSAFDGSSARAVLDAPVAAADAASGSARRPTLARRAWTDAKDVYGAVRGMAFGDPTLEPLLAASKETVGTERFSRTLNEVRLFLSFDAIFAFCMSALTGPLLDTALKAAHQGLAIYAPHLAVLTGLMLASLTAYTLSERAHASRSQAVVIQATTLYRIAMLRSLLGQEMDFHLQHGSGALAGQLLTGTSALGDKNVGVRLSVFHYALYAACGTALLLHASPAIGAAVLAVVPALSWISAKYGDKILALGVKQTAQKAELMRYGQEILAQAETVKTFGSTKEEIERYGRRVDKAAELDEQEATLSANYSFFSGGVGEFFAKHLVYILGAWGLAMTAAGGGALGALTYGKVIQLTMFAGFVKYAFTGLSLLYLKFRRNQGASQTAREMLLRRPAIADRADAIELPAGPGEVRFEGVTFAYPERKAEPVLDGLTFEARAGQTIAFVGETGSGKSTITRLLLRQWEPTGGRVTVDGRDVRDVTRASLMSRIATVPQETHLFNGTLRENMLFGSETATETDLIRAVRRAKADFVFDPVRFPQGLDTPVAEGGSRLSGGERQRVAIVRALLRSPSILILDEATSALDNKAERDIQSALDDLSSGDENRRPTTLVVAHRLSTIRNADRINFLEKGVVVESGTHQELLALNGRYARLWREGGYDAAGDDVGAKTEPAETTPENAAPKSVPAMSKTTSSEETRSGVRALLSSVREFLVGDRGFGAFVSPWAVRGAAVLFVIQAAAELAGSKLLGGFLKAAVDASGPALMWKLSLGIGAAFAAAALAQRESSLLLGRIRARARAAVRRALMARLQAKPMSFFLKNESGALASRLNEDSDSLVVKNVDARAPLLHDVVSLAGGSILLLRTNLAAGLLMLALIPVLGVVSGVFGQKTAAVFKTYGQRRAELGRQGQETLEQILTIKTFAREDSMLERYRRKAVALFEIGEIGSKLTATSHMVSSALTDFFTRHLIYILGAWAVARSAGLTVDQITTMTLYAGFVKAGFDGVAANWLRFQQAEGEVSVAKGWLASSDAIDAPSAKTLPHGAGEIVFENVSFRYGEDSSGGQVENFSLRIEPGTKVALVGASGSGKSTVLKLLQGLWTPQEGRVLIDGMNQAEATRASVAEAIAKVPQSTRLFDASLRENMTYGSAGVTDEQLRAAIRAARADFIDDARQFPQGLDTPVGEGGAKLSGGQRQRVAIVRALLKNPRILVLDEATSALDKKTEREIQATLDSIADGRTGRRPTTVVVAHNLTTVMDAGKIVVMDAGRIVEQGTHAELLARGGAYARLWRASRGEQD